jgi:hypothetical protein
MDPARPPQARTSHAAWLHRPRSARRPGRPGRSPPPPGRRQRRTPAGRVRSRQLIPNVDAGRPRPPVGPQRQQRPPTNRTPSTAASRAPPPQRRMPAPGCCSCRWTAWTPRLFPSVAAKSSVQARGFDSALCLLQPGAARCRAGSRHVARPQPRSFPTSMNTRHTGRHLLVSSIGPVSACPLRISPTAPHAAQPAISPERQGSAVLVILLAHAGGAPAAPVARATVMSAAPSSGQGGGRGNQCESRWCGCCGGARGQRGRQAPVRKLIQHR